MQRFQYNRHREVCNIDRGSKDDKQGQLPFARGKAAKFERGLGDVARLVYDDGIPVSKIVKSETLQKTFKQLNFSEVSKHSINRQLENEYQAMFQIVKSIIAGRDPSDVLCVSFDKWTTSDGVKFLGI